MKAALQNYNARMQRMLDYIDQHLDGDLDLETLSRVAAFSKFHFHRQFTATFGLSVHRYVQLARLKENVGYEPVRGWLIFDYSVLNKFRFMSHSVIQGPDARLFDLTPVAAPRPPFLRHEGPEGEFEAIVMAGHIWLDHHLPKDVS